MPNWSERTLSNLLVSAQDSLNRLAHAIRLPCNSVDPLVVGVEFIRSLFSPQIMGVSSYYEIVPQELIDAIRSDIDLASAIDCLWGYGSGMYAWFAELDEHEIKEIVHCRRISNASVEKLRNLLSRSEAFPAAYIEKTHEAHESMLHTAFMKHGAQNANELASVSVMGDGDWGFGTRLAFVSNKRCQELAAYMEDCDIIEIVRDFTRSNGTYGSLWRKGLTSELQSIIRCYRIASAKGHHVLTGST